MKDAFVANLKEWLDQEEVLHWGLVVEGPQIVDRLCSHQSLRSLAKASGFSPTYLSQVRNRKTILNAEGYLRLAEIEEATP